jgi:lipid-binding SYLF domain-containing protein
MAGYSTSSPPIKLAGTGPAGGQLWYYYSATDAVATVRGAGYFSNGDALGMRVGDVVISVDHNTPLTSLSAVSSVTKGGAATVAAG